METPPVTLDATGLRCPLPVVRMEAALRRMTPGARLLVRADDPVAAVDIPHFARVAGCLVERLPDEGADERRICVFMVTRGENRAPKPAPPLAPPAASGVNLC